MTLARIVRRSTFSFLSLLGVFVGSVHSIHWFDPQQVHISTTSFDQMIIVWTTVNKTETSIVQYGKGNTITQHATGESHDFVHAGPSQRVSYIHKVVLTNLAPQTKYTYRVGSPNYKWSDIFSFKTWPQGDNWSPRLAVYGDLGFENPQSMPRLLSESYQGMYDSILHVGDIAYDLSSHDGTIGDEFMRMIEPLAASVPYMTCPGNHEEDHNFLEYRNRFEMPGDENKRMYYSYTMGPVRFISLSTELIFYPQYGIPRIIKQYEWLEQELQNANKPENRAKHPWVVTFGHRPMYCSNDNSDDCTHHESLTRVGVPFAHILPLEKLFYQYGIDLAIWGHEHSYERLWPVYNRQVKNGSFQNPYTNPGATVHIVTGSAGCKFHHDHFNFLKTADEWSAFRSEDYGYTRMKVYNATHLYLEQVSDDKGGDIIDNVMIINYQHGSFIPDPRPVKPVGNPLESLTELWKKIIAAAS